MFENLQCLRRTGMLTIFKQALILTMPAFRAAVPEAWRFRVESPLTSVAAP